MAGPSDDALPPSEAGSSHTPARPDKPAGAAVGPAQIGHGIAIPLQELSWRFSASGGAGGQHVNTANTKVEVRFDVAGSPSLPEWARRRLLAALGAVVAVTASDRRSQLRNRELAVERLSRRLAAALRAAPPRQPTRPTRASQRRRVEAKRRQGARKQERRSPNGDDE